MKPTFFPQIVIKNDLMISWLFLSVFCPCALLLQPSIAFKDSFTRQPNRLGICSQKAGFLVHSTDFVTDTSHKKKFWLIWKLRKNCFWSISGYSKQTLKIVERWQFFAHPRQSRFIHAFTFKTGPNRTRLNYKDKFS